MVLIEDMVSRKHAKLSFGESKITISDMGSTNGTFVNKSTRRIQSPYKLADGDELLIGDYIISVSVKGNPAAHPPPSVASRLPPDKPADPQNIWTGIGEPPPPINPQDLMPPAERPGRGADFLEVPLLAEVPVVGGAGRRQGEPSGQGDGGHVGEEGLSHHLSRIPARRPVNEGPRCPLITFFTTLEQCRAGTGCTAR